ncbi:hypothetical protein SAMN05421810_11393 [Amycolatopsis arida]|uniref:TetR family transcriptional regulator n=1 Tax=Amycolatopsis arida TaxID=587909 RepID=A0A1I6AMI8_9PSEU|nr:hypothetical protein [Amycolatopsis arida]TDX87410.1 hypothetical protein CLV69_11393 [Amycolatopsis arida]SFQ69921.1 hypothetical protein SAMN05421810_11393 [Amycolatopsis arida]
MLRDGFVGHLREYRRQLAERARADLEERRLPGGLPANGVAMVVSAAIDGLLLHAGADPQFEYEQAHRHLGGTAVD